MNDVEFKNHLHGWFHPSQQVEGGVLWNPGDEVLPWEVVELQYLWYKRLGEWLRPKHILEVGVGYGYSIMSLQSGITDELRLTLVDNESQWEGSLTYATALLSLSSSGGRRWHEFHSWEAFYDYHTENAQYYDLIHIDANHEYEHVTRDAFESYNYAQKGAHWLFHDSDDPPVAQAAEELAEWNKLKWFKIPEVRCGMHVVHSCEDGACSILKGMAEMNG